MRCFRRPSAARAAVLALAVVCTAAGQTMLDLRSQAKNIDFSAANSTRPFPVGTSLPPICSTGQTYFRADAPSGRNLYLCTATNTWAVVDGAQSIRAGNTGGVTVNPDEEGVVLSLDPSVVAMQDGNNTWTGHNNFSGASSLSVVVMTSRPPDADCDAAAEAGRVVLRRSDPTQAANVLYMCQATSSGTYGWKASSYAYGSGKPLTCTAGELFFDISAPAGQQWFGCVTTNTWTNLGGSGSSLPAQTNNGGKILGTNGTAAGWRTMAGFTDDGSRLKPDGTVLGELAGNNTWIGHQRFPASATQTLSAAASRITCNRHTVAITAASALTLTSAPTIPAAADGQVCVIVNVGDADITLQDQDTLPSSNMQLNAPQIAIRAKGQISLQYNESIGNWIQDGVASGASASAGLQDTASTGLVAQVGPSGAVAARTITGRNGITVTNGSGVAGNPDITIPGWAKGDLMVHSGSTNTRLPVGTNGQTLVADATAGTGVKWTARTIAGGNGLTASNGDWSAGTAATLSLPGAAKGDLMVHDGSTNVALPVGTNGQIPVADSTQAAGIRWGSLTGSNGVTVTGQTVSMPGWAKGDLIVHSGSSNTRLAVGTNGQIPVADSTQAAGIRWGSLTGSNGVTVTGQTVSMPGAAKGDLTVHNGSTNVALPVGTNGQIPIADSTQPAGIRWGSPATSLPGAAKGDLIVHNGSTNVAQPAGANGTFLQYDSSQPSGVAAAAAATVRKCSAPSATVSGTTITSLDSVMLTGIAPGGLIRATARFSATGAANAKTWQFRLAGSPLGDEVQSGTASLSIWVNSETAITGTAEEYTSSFQMMSSGNANSSGLSAGTGRSTLTTIDVSSGSAAFSIWGRTLNAGDTLTLRHWCVEYVAATN